jgi:hypothetical protein
MAYYNKKDILEYVSENIKIIESKNLKPLNPESEVIKRLNDEEDMIGFFWIELSSGEVGEKIKMEGKSWYRINHDIYTDDRFAIDLYQAMKADLTVTDVIKKRELEKERASQGIVDIENLEKRVEENIKKDGD